MIFVRKSGSNLRQDPRETTAGGAAPTLVFLALMIAATTMVAARASIVSVAPATAAAYARLGMPVTLRGLAIEGVRATFTETAENRELLVTGEIVNLREAETPVGNLRLVLRGEGQRERYVWTARGPKTELGPHERVPFRARLASPPDGVRDVLVKFAASGDKASPGE